MFSSVTSLIRFWLYWFFVFFSDGDRRARPSAAGCIHYNFLVFISPFILCNSALQYFVVKCYIWSRNSLKRWPSPVKDAYEEQLKQLWGAVMIFISVAAHVIFSLSLHSICWCCLRFKRFKLFRGQERLSASPCSSDLHRLHTGCFSSFFFFFHTQRHRSVYIHLNPRGFLPGLDASSPIHHLPCFKRFPVLQFHPECLNPFSSRHFNWSLSLSPPFTFLQLWVNASQLWLQLPCFFFFCILAF